MTTDGPRTEAGNERVPCAIKVEGSIGACLLVGTDYRVGQIREHHEPSSVQGEPPAITTIIRFDPVLRAIEARSDSDSGVTERLEGGHRPEFQPIDLDEIEMRWASQWNAIDDGEVRAWRADVARLIDEIRSRQMICGVLSNRGPNLEPLACGFPPNPSDEPMHEHSWATLPTFVPATEPRSLSEPLDVKTIIHQRMAVLADVPHPDGEQAPCTACRRDGVLALLDHWPAAAPPVETPVDREAEIDRIATDWFYGRHPHIADALNAAYDAGLRSPVAVEAVSVERLADALHDPIDHALDGCPEQDLNPLCWSLATQLLAALRDTAVSGERVQHGDHDHPRGWPGKAL